MNFKIIGGTDCPLAHVYLKNGEKVMVERGAMAYMSDVSIEGKMNSNKGGLGGLFSAIGRSLTSGESMFITEAVGTSDHGVIGIAPNIPGKIAELKVGDNQYRLNTGAFLTCDASVTYNMAKQDVGKALFAGTGGLFVMETAGSGTMLINAFGDIVELTVSEDHPITIDNQHVLAWDAALDYKIEIASGTFGFKTGEGFVNKFTGNGKVLIQTRNIESLAEVLIPYIPTQTSSSSN